ncbi:MAG: 50S ribosomal protein L15 [Candidatus Aminicenantes bacterium]|nr:50S ribosomal protein L15 [Candidatus Aminicenantes bacterium]
MNLSNLRSPKGAKSKTRRVGRGPGSGRGKTAGRGHKGQLSGAGYSAMKGFEGGQMPLVRRLPKRGFTNIFRTAYTVVNLDRLDKIAKDEIAPKDLVEARLIKKESERVKILARGPWTKPITVRAHAFSASARRKIEAAGGKALLIEGRHA